MKTKLSPRFWCALTLFSLIGQVAWVVENMYLNVFIYKMFHASAGDISAMVAASAIAATITTILIGALSDRIGKRKLFICGGYILWGISVFCFGLLRLDWISAAFPMVTSAAAVGVSLTIILDCIMTFFGSSANDAAFNAWLTDSTDHTNRGSAEGINSMMPLVAILVVFGGFMAFNLDKAESWTLIFTIIGIVVTLVGILGIFLIRDSNTPPSQTGYWQNVIYGFRPSTVRRNPALYIHLAAFIIFNISIQIFMPYLIIYYEVSLGMTNYVLIMAPAIILASAATAFWGKAYDKKGFRLSSFIALIALMVGYVLLFLFRSTVPVFIGSLFMMCGYLCGMAVFGAKIRDLTPAGKAGMLQGVRIFSQVLVPGVIGPYIGKAVLANAQQILNNDGTYSFVPNENIFLAALVPAVIVLVLLVLFSEKKPPRLCSLKTPFESDSSTSWEEEYPRPQMKRDSYLSLCGNWDLSCRIAEQEEPLGTIRVPFPPESRLSGIERQLKKGEQYIYRTTFSLPADFNRGRVLLNFGAVDQITTVYVNDTRIGGHVGGYLPFTLDITDALCEEENHLRVEVIDRLDPELPYGKQRRDRGGMWYTPISGIWQPVWLESVPEEHITSLKLSPTLDSVTLEVNGGKADKLVTVQTSSGMIEHRFTGERTTISIPSPILWTPENPHLYFFTLTDGEDTVESYFALRTVTIENTNAQAYICLNGKPMLFHGLLDQGYFSDGIYLPATPAGYLYDIQTMKSLGFNMLRKHIKVEPDLFYYYCDKYGMVVFQDMINSGKYRFFFDTALPTIGLKRGISHRASSRRRETFERDLREMVWHLYNHPCVCYYTIFNEGWGQYDADRIYNEMKVLDPSRIWDATSGWFTGRNSDVTSDHVYFRKLNLKVDPKRPCVLSEFGGYSLKLPDHSFNLDQTYGYRKYTDRTTFVRALEALYRKEVIPAIQNGLCAAVLTQVSDVEDETNGLVTYDRQVVKVDQGPMAALALELHQAFHSKVN